MKGKHKGAYWTTHVNEAVLRDAERFGIEDDLLELIVEHFHAIGEVEDPTTFNGVVKLREYEKRNIFRQKFCGFTLLRKMRNLIIQIDGKDDGHLFLVGIFARSNETYSEDIPNRLKELHLA